MMYAIAGGTMVGIASSLLFLLFGRFLATSSIIQGVLHIKLGNWSLI